MKKLSIGIVGLPNVGKSTLFKLLTKQEVNIANYPFCTIDPNVGVVSVPDERLNKLAEMSKSEKTIPAVVEFYDIAGLVKGANKGEGLGNQFLSYIREVNAIVEVVRIFKDSEITHVEGSVDPLRDMETIDLELQLKDEQSKEKENLLSLKPKILLFNGRPEDIPTIEGNLQYITADLSGNPDLSGLIRKAYEVLGLISFFTTGEKETRAWTIGRGSKAPEAAGVIHTDFQNKFIRAETIQWDKLLEAGSWQKAKAKGWIRTEGKDYVVEEGDVMLIRHS